MKKYLLVMIILIILNLLVLFIFFLMKRRTIEKFDIDANETFSSRMLSFNNCSSDDLIIIFTSQISVNKIPESLLNAINNNSDCVMQNDSKYILGIVKKGESLNMLVTIDSKETGSCDYHKDEQAKSLREFCFNSINIQVYKNQIYPYYENEEPIYAKGNLQIEFTFEDGTDDIVDTYDISAIPDGTCGSHMHKLSTQFGAIDSTNCGGDNDCLENEYAYNPKKEGVSDTTYVESCSKDKNDIYVCGLSNKLKSGFVPECIEERTQLVNGIEVPHCKKWSKDTIYNAMDEIWKCVTRVNDKKPQYNIELVPPGGESKYMCDNKNMDIEIENDDKIDEVEEGQQETVENTKYDDIVSDDEDIIDEVIDETNDNEINDDEYIDNEVINDNNTEYKLPGYNYSTIHNYINYGIDLFNHLTDKEYENENKDDEYDDNCCEGFTNKDYNCIASKVMIDESKSGFSMDNYKNWNISELLSVDNGFNDPSVSDFNAYIYPYNEELFEGPSLTCNDTKKTFTDSYYTIENLVSSIGTKDNEYYYKTNPILNENKEGIETKQYIMNIYDFGKVKKF